MLSSLALKSRALAPLVKQGGQQWCGPVMLVRASSSGMMKHVENWEKANQVYYGPERDTKNFPHPKLPMKTPPTRLGFIPEAWFTAFYDKTGVTGPYVLGTGVLAFLFSKELWVVEHGFTEFLSFWIAFAIIAKKWGPGIGKALDKSDETFVKNNWDQPITQLKAGSTQLVEDTEKAIWREEGQKHLFEAKRENVDLQLESIYRQRLQDAHQAVKKRLDYQLAIENSKRTFEQNHMVDWIVQGVVKSITPQQEKESLAKCIADLKALSATAKA